MTFWAEGGDTREGVAPRGPCSALKDVSFKFEDGDRKKMLKGQAL
jgi:hypothetical protein